MSENDTQKKLRPTSGPGDRIPTFVLLLGWLLIIALVPFISMALRTPMTDGSGSLWTVLKSLFYLALVLIGIIAAFFVGKLLAYLTVDLHHGRYRISDEIPLLIIGSVLALFALYGITNLYGLRALPFLDNIIQSVRSWLDGALDLPNNDTDLRRTFLEAYLWVGLCGAGMAREALKLRKDYCPACERYGSTFETLIKSDVTGVTHRDESSTHQTGEDLDGFWGGKGTGISMDMLRSMPRSEQNTYLQIYGTENLLDGSIELSGRKKYETVTKHYEITHYHNVYRVECKYCGYLVKVVERDESDEKKTGSTTSESHEDVKYKVR